jgi:hypothetical protein
MPSPYQLLTFTEDNLALAFETAFFKKDYIKKNRFHYRYFLDYLGNSSEDSLKAKTILIENEYLSRDFLYDFSNYYSLCFSDDYKKKCKRIHFFSSEISEHDFLTDYLENTNNVINDNNYLGYIVVKELPNVLIGSTILKTYSSNTKKRIYITKNYKVHLFGKELKISSIAFQEQDKAVSACATSALWAAFQKTSSLFQTQLPTPFEITTSSGNLFNESGRNFPNGGLDHFQIGNAIKNVGLVFELRNQSDYLKDHLKVKAFIYSYMKMGIPVLIGIDIKDKGWHLITLLGFAETKLSFKKNKRLSLIAEQLSEFYAHDDQIGPYSRFKFQSNWLTQHLETSWWIDKKGTQKRKAELISIFVPIYDKIRISFDDIYKAINYFDIYLFKVLLSDEVIWDIFLYKSDLLKFETISDSELSPRIKNKILFSSFPKYVWVARAFANNERLIEFIFDSTGIAKGFYCICINSFNDDLKERISIDIENPDFKDFITTNLHPKFIELLAQEGNDI